MFHIRNISLLLNSKGGHIQIHVNSFSVLKEKQWAHVIETMLRLSNEEPIDKGEGVKWISDKTLLVRTSIKCV